MARLLGYDSPQELIGADVHQIWDEPNHRDRMIAQLNEHRNLSNYEVRLRRKDGQLTWALLNANQTEPQGGDGPGVECTVFDITERKKAEEKLLLTQFSIECASDAVTWLDPEGRIVYVNNATCTSLGWSREEPPSTIADINPDFIRAPWEWKKEWERIKAAGSTTMEASHITRDGKVFPVEVTATYQEFGGREYIFTFARNITQRKDAERQMNLQATALNAAANGIVIADQKAKSSGSTLPLCP